MRDLRHITGVRKGKGTTRDGEIRAIYPHCVVSLKDLGGRLVVVCGSSVSKTFIPSPSYIPFSLGSGKCLPTLTVPRLLVLTPPDDLRI